MRLVIVIAFLFLLVFSKAGFARKHPLEFKLYYAGYTVSPPSWVGTKPDTLHCFAMVLTNTSNKDVKFGHYTCSWSGIFEPVNNEIDYFGYHCTANFPTTTTLKPGQSCTNYEFFTKLFPSINNVQMDFLFFEEESLEENFYRDLIPNEKGKKGVIISPLFIRSNICKIDSKISIDYFEHLSFSGPGIDMYRRLYVQDIFNNFGYDIYQHHNRYFH